MRLTTNPRNPLRAPILPAVINLALVLLSLPRLMVQANPFLPWPSNTNNVVRGASRAHVLVVDVRGGGAFFGGSSGKRKPPSASIFHSELATTASKKVGRTNRISFVLEVLVLYCSVSYRWIFFPL